MTNKNEHGRTEAEEARIDAIAARIVEGSDKIEAQVPADAYLTRDLLWLYLMHTDENFDTDTPPAEVIRKLVRSVFHLERRLLDVEKALKARGRL